MSDPTARRSISLDGEWRFVRDPDRRVIATDLPGGEPIRVPGCWEAQVSDPFGIVHAWYHRRLPSITAWRGAGRVFLRCEAVMYQCEVWLNGRRIGHHEGGYSPFEVELDGASWDGPNHLALRVTNPVNALGSYPEMSVSGLRRAQKSSAGPPISEIPHGKQTWYASQSGPWRSVAVELRPDVHLASMRTAPHWASGTVRIAGSIRPASQKHQVGLEVLGPDGRVAVAETVGVTEAGGFAADLHVAERRAWDIGQPNLYRVNARLLRHGRAIDWMTDRFGFREVRTEGGRVILNGRPILLRGALDQDLYDETMSTPPSRELLDRQLRLAGEMGLNLLRCHIKSPDPAYLDAADEAGVLLWCELPSWLVLTPDSARRGERTLDELVDAVGSHPSVIIWTIINEDWGTDLRHSPADRRWLRGMAAHLRQRDPSRLVVDNSPCPTGDGPNFHLDTDIADFHLYAAMPDAAPRWRVQMAELAERPAWLWSPHGDAKRRGEEPVVVSEYGNWGLPDLHRHGRPWWVDTGDGPTRPADVEQRFTDQRLDRIWPDAGALAVGTQWHQFEALQFETGEIRRHPGMAGMVVTELTDAHWEANGLLELDRRPKAGHARLAEVLGPVSLIPEMARRDLWANETVDVAIDISSEVAGEGGSLRWRLGSSSGSVAVGAWAAASATHLAEIRIPVPDVRDTSDVELSVELVGANEQPVARVRVSCAVVPAHLRRSPMAQRVWAGDPLHVWQLGEVLEAAGHVVRQGQPAPRQEEVVVTSQLDRGLVRFAESGGRVLLLGRSDDAVAKGARLDRPLRIRPRRPGADGVGQDFTWTGDWVSAFSWITPDLSADLPKRAPLDFAYAEVLPDHVLDGYDPDQHADEVTAGMFVGWVHAPAALIWSFPQGRGRVTVTTFHVCPEVGPVATLLLDALLRLAARDGSAARPLA